MTPTDIISDCSLYRGDCLKVLASMPDASVDHIITDPPYSEIIHSGARTMERGIDGRNFESVPLIGFKSIDSDFFIRICTEFLRVANRWIIMTCDWRHIAAVETSGLPMIRCGIWVKPDSAPQFTGDRPGTGWEAVMILHRKGRKRWNGGGHHAVWTCGMERDCVHPTQKPLKLVRKWVRDFTDDGDTILDPFMGSGTTLLASVREGRKAIGIELDPTHYETAKQRLTHATGEGPGQLFSPDLLSEVG